MTSCVSDDHARVVLELEEGDIHSDYINADYITGYKDREQAFIAAQGTQELSINSLSLLAANTLLGALYVNCANTLLTLQINQS